MTVERRTDTIVLSGQCGVEEVDLLVEQLESAPHLAVDLTGATTIHTALWQALMVYKPTLVALPVSTPAMDLVFSAVSHHIAEARSS